MINELLNDCVQMRKELRNLRKLLLAKKLSQHFMKDCSIGYSFTEALGSLGGECIIEVGSGIGFLTRFISRVAKQVITVELDLRLIPYLKKYVKDLQNVHIVAGDGRSLLNGCRCDTLVSNTPYHISSPLLVNFVKSDLRFAVLMLQREVAERLISCPGERNYGRITAFLNTFTSITKVKDFPSSSFLPKPKVDSSLVILTRKRLWNNSWLTYEDMLRYIFTQRRKLAKKVFKNYVQGLKISLPERDFNCLDDKRVFELSVDDLIHIHEIINEALIKSRGLRNH